MNQTKAGKGKQWLVLPVVLLFLCACGTQKQTVELSSEVYELPQNCAELTVTLYKVRHGGIFFKLLGL